MQDLLTVIRFSILFVYILFPVTLRADDVMNVRVDASQNLGAVPPILSGSIWIQDIENNGGNSYAIDKFFQDNKPATVQLSIPILRHSSSFEDYKMRLMSYANVEATDILLKKVKAYNTLLIIGFDPCPMPVWLSTNPRNMLPLTIRGEYDIQSCSPPKSYELWSEVVKYTIGYFRSLGLNNLGFYVGHEPNRDWLGSEDTLYRYYTYASKAVKSVGKDIKIGGIGSWSYDGAKLKCDDSAYTAKVKKMCSNDGGWDNPDDDPITKNFIEYVAKHNVALDFINWHSFASTPKDFLKQAKAIRKWLKESGFERVHLYPSDWTYWGGDYPADYLDTTESASYIVQSLYYMLKAGISWHGHDFDVSNGALENNIRIARKKTNFIGDWSVFTWGGGVGGGVVKPTYNAFAAISKINNDGVARMISADFPDNDTITAISTLTEIAGRQRIYLLMSNFVPQDEKFLQRYILEKLEAEIDFVKEDMKAIMGCVKKNRYADNGSEGGKFFLQCKGEVLSGIHDPVKAEALNYLGKIYKCIAAKKHNCIFEASKSLKYLNTVKIASIVEKYAMAKEQATNVKVELMNLPFNGMTSIATYKIDGAHSNACNFNKKTEPSFHDNIACGVGGSVDKAVWKAKEASRAEGISAAVQYMQLLGYKNKTISLLKESLKKCIGNGNGMRECLNKIGMEISSLQNIKYSKVMTDLISTVNKFKEVSQLAYYGRINKVNSWKEISFEGSKETRTVSIGGNYYTFNLEMEPNSVWLIELSKIEM